MTGIKPLVVLATRKLRRQPKNLSHLSGLLSLTKQRTSTKMALLPLQNLLNIPMDGLTLVVDNARSPEISVSMRSKQRTARRPRTRRAVSWDGVTLKNRWSSMLTPPPPTSSDSPTEINPTAPRRSKRPIRRTTPQRACSVDILDQVYNPNASTTIRMPIRKASPLVTANRKRIDAPKPPQHSPSPSSVLDRKAYTPPAPLHKPNYNEMTGLRIPQRHKSPQVSLRKRNSDLVGNQEYRGMSTQQLLNHALDHSQETM